MTDKIYTGQELEEMADQLLAADDKKKDEKTADKKPESAKINDKTLEEKLGKCPAAALLAGNEKLRELFIKGKKKGRLEPAELSEVVDAMDLDGDQMDSIYDSLADLGIDIVTEDFTNDIPEDMEPAMEEIAEIEEEELVDPNTLVDSFNIDDPVRMYLKEIGKVPLLTGEQEIKLATAMSAGNTAKEKLAQVETGGLTLTEEELAQAKADLKAGEKAKKQLAEANLRLVVSIAKRYVGRGMLFCTAVRSVCDLRFGRYSRIPRTSHPMDSVFCVSIVRASGNGHWMTMGVIGELDSCAVGCGEGSGRFRAMSSSIDNFFSDPEFIFHVLL